MLFTTWYSMYKLYTLRFIRMYAIFCMWSAKYTVQDLVAVNYTVLFLPHLTSTWNRVVNKYVHLKGISDLFKKKN